MDTDSIRKSACSECARCYTVVASQGNQHWRDSQCEIPTHLRRFGHVRVRTDCPDFMIRPAYAD